MYKTLLFLFLLISTSNIASAEVPSVWNDNFDSYSDGSVCSVSTFSCFSGPLLNIISSDSDTPSKSIKSMYVGAGNSSFTKSPGTNLKTDSNVTSNIYFSFAFKPNSLNANRVHFSFGTLPNFTLQLGLAGGTHKIMTTYSGDVVSSTSVLNYDAWNNVYVHFNKTTGKIRYKIGEGSWSPTVSVDNPSSDITSMTFQFVAGGGTNSHLIDSIAVSNIDPTPLIISRIVSALPLDGYATTTSTSVTFSAVYHSSNPTLKEICLFLTGITTQQSFLEKCQPITISGENLSFATTTSFTNNGVYSWHISLFDINNNLVDMTIERDFLIGTNANPNQAWEDFLVASATTTPIDVTSFCNGMSFTIGSVCELIMSLYTPIQAPVNNAYIQIRDVILSKVPFVYIVQINNTFRASQLTQTLQFQGVEVKLLPQTTVTVLSNQEITNLLSQDVLNLIRSIMVAVIWLSVLMFFWSQRNVFKI